MKKVILYASIIISLLLLKINVYSQTPNFVWVKSAGGTESEEAYSICVDASGNTYITGLYDSPSLTFGSTTLINNNAATGGVNVFVVKYDATGNVVWAKSSSGTKQDFGKSICVDASGNTYITGLFISPSITFGTLTLTNNSATGFEDLFIVKYDANGNVIWAKSAGGNFNDEGRSICVDATGNTYITGNYESSTITFGSTTLSNIGYTNLFVVKYDANGNTVWAKSAGGSDEDYGNSICVDASGNTYITGNYLSPSISFGSTSLSNYNTTGYSDIFTVKYNANGNAVWAKRAGNNKDDIGQSICLDASGNTYITGCFSSRFITIGSTTIMNHNITGSSDTTDIFVVKYDANGNVVWVNSAGGMSYDYGNSICVDANGNTYITGSFESPSITFGLTTLLNYEAGYSDLFVLKYDANGSVVWAKSVGGDAYDDGKSICVDASGSTYFTGSFSSSSVTFGSTTFNSIRLWDIFIAKLSGSVGIQENENTALKYLIYPNPAKDNLIIELKGNKIIQNTSLSIYNIQGQLLKQFAIKESKTEIDIQSFSTGIYIVKVNNEKENFVSRFVKE